MAFAIEAAKNIGDFAGQPPFREINLQFSNGTEQLRRSHEFQIDPVQRVLGQMAAGSVPVTAEIPLLRELPAPGAASKERTGDGPCGSV
jgi:hypothetical protein